MDAVIGRAFYWGPVGSPLWGCDMGVITGVFMAIFCSWHAFWGRDMHAVAAFSLWEDRDTGWNNDMEDIVGWWLRRRGGGLRVWLRQRW